MAALARVERVLSSDRAIVLAAIQHGAFCRCEVRCDGYAVAVGDLVRVEGVDLGHPDADARIVGVGLSN